MLQSRKSGVKPGYETTSRHYTHAPTKVNLAYNLGCSLWLDGHDPVPYLRTALPRTRVIHLHGIAGRDHKSLAHVPFEKLDPVVETLCRANYSGVLTLEVFSEDDLVSSIAVLERSTWVTCRNDTEMRS